MKGARSVGYFLWGVLWLILSVSVLLVPVMVVFMRLNGSLTRGGEGGGSIVVLWLLGVPLCAWVFIIFPFVAVQQALMGIIASGMALRPQHRETQLVGFVGTTRHRIMEARIDTPAMRVLTAVGEVGTIPGWVFGISAVVITTGFGVLVSTSGPVGALAAAVIVTMGAGGAVVGIRTRINDELKKPPPVAVDAHGLTEKYYKGLRYREDKRARDLQKARDAGRAGDIATWGAAEAEHALRTYSSAAYAARKGVPGALDAAFADVFMAMDGAVTRQQAEELVITAAAYRGKKPVPVRATR